MSGQENKPALSFNLKPSQDKLGRLSEAAHKAPDWAIDAAIKDLESSTLKYQVALSFAGEQRSYVDKVARRLQKLGIAVFYDDFEQVNLWGRNLTEVFDEVFTSKSAWVVMFVSKAYVEKEWPTLERRFALNHMIKEKREYILPVRFDDTVVSGLPGDVHYFHAGERTEAELASFIAEKIGISLYQT